MIEQRSLLIFEQSIKSPATRKNYRDHLDRFLEYTRLKDYDALVSVPTNQMETILQDYVIYLKKTVNPNSVGTYMTGVKHFFTMNRVKIYWELIQKLYPKLTKRSGAKSWTDKQIKQMIDFTPVKRNRAIIHFLASTGSRVGVFDYPLQMRHLRNMEDNCKAVLLYAGEIEEYWAFLTPEASNSLEEYFDERQKDGEKFFEDTPVFRTTYRLGIEKAKQLSKNAVISMMFRIIRRAKIDRVRVNRNFDVQMDHGFRKRFNSILKLNNAVNSNIAEKIMGHSVTIQLDNTYLPTHDPRVMAKCFEEFKKAMPELTIDDTERKTYENMKLREELSEKNKLFRDIEDLKLKFGRHEIERDELKAKMENRIKELEDKLKADRKNSDNS